MLEYLEKCPLCNSGHFNKYITTKDYTVSHEEFTLVTCDDCNLLFTNPRPLTQELSKYYKSSDYISHSNKSTNLTQFLYKLARRFTLTQKVKLINSLSKKGKVLDIGCGTGHFLKACQDSKWNVQGVEPDSAARSIAQAQTGMHLYENIDEIEESDYKIITLWHVLEHVPDLNDFVQKLKNLLAENGTLVIAVPNYKSYDAQNYEKHWAGYDVPRHLYHFEPFTMRKLSKKYGFEIKQILPMKLDAFYVSLLSETYKGSGITKYTNSIINGCKSNIYAKNNDKNYSSLIYIIKSSNG